MHRLVRISLVNSLTTFPIEINESYLRLQMVILHMWLGYMEKMRDMIEKSPDFDLVEEEIFEEKSLWTKITQCYELEAFNFVGGQE